ncbi:roquin-2 isoform X2 [Planococcus citri]|uniref:roquin-2 isoform X2 n=1 Tax=Planococcus citri TaxID=170843 RepID=UPI0031F74D86
MPIQTPQWTDFLICPVCCNEYDYLHNPISLACGHTVCKLCLSKLQIKQCPFDQTAITIDLNDLPVNYALLQLVSSTVYNLPEKNQTQMKLQSKVKLNPDDTHHYAKALKRIEDIALYLKPFSSVLSTSGAVNVLSRPMQRKLVMLINCQLLEEEGRIRALKAARSLGERTVTELIIQHQNPQQLSTNLWAAVRARGCQFLGPAMQEEVLKLVLLALEDGSALSRKVLVMFVVQRLEPHFPQASKTSIGHVVQLLYRASCFVVSKREGDSSLMKLKEEFRTYDALRREHDAQIVEIATEAGLRIAPDQWSALLYGDTAHKSHMQSIIDKLQNPQSFAQSVQELVIALQRTGDPGNLCVLRPHLEYLADIDVNSDFGNRIWSTVSTALEAALTVVSGLVNFIKTHGCRKMNNDPANNISVHASKYKISLCRDLALKGLCPRGISCTFAHSEEELVKYRSKHRKFQRKENENMLPFVKSTNNNSAAIPSRNIDLNMEDCGQVLNQDVCTEKNDCCFCRPCEFPTDFNQLTLLQPNDVLNTSPLMDSTPLTINNNVRKITSSQYLVAMNQRKQQIISELQQVLSGVQNQYFAANNSEVNPNVNVYCPTSCIPNAPYILGNPLPPSTMSMEIQLPSQSDGLPFQNPVQLNKLDLSAELCSLSSEQSFLPPRSVPLDRSVNLVHTCKDPYLGDGTGNWNMNYSKLCCSCGVPEGTGVMAIGDAFQSTNHYVAPDEVPESLLLESVKLQGQLRGLKKQIADIKNYMRNENSTGNPIKENQYQTTNEDKTYEEGIVNDLRALELRLECELEEEEEKLWPTPSKK